MCTLSGVSVINIDVADSMPWCDLVILEEIGSIDLKGGGLKFAEIPLVFFTNLLSHFD